MTESDGFNYDMFDAGGRLVAAPRTHDEILGETVHVLMRRSGKHQKMLAAFMNVTQATISNKLRGTRPWTLGDIVKTADFLEVSIDTLLEEVERARRDSNSQPSDPDFAQVSPHLRLIISPDMRRSA